MKLTNTQITQAKRLGLVRAISTATDTAFQRKARQLRAENQRRFDAAK